MDLRTKYVFALVAVALGSMLVLGAVTYTSARGLLVQSNIDRLEGLADSKKEGLERVLAGWRERIRLIGSRTQLRLSLRSFSATASPADAQRIERILGDALRASRHLTTLVVYERDGDLVSWSRRGTSLGLPRNTPRTLPAAGLGTTYQGAFVTALGRHEVAWATTLELEGEVIGTLLATWEAEEIADLTREALTLGRTGEVLVVRPDSAGGAAPLHPQRSADAEAVLGDPGSLARRVLEGEEGTLTDGIVDGRGENVWATLRFVPDPGWGVIVKVDQSEIQSPILTFRRELIRLALSVAALSILLATILGLRVAKPIHDLAAVAKRIRDGELGARADATREDEVGGLARTFNDMADELEQRMELLREFRRFFDESLELLCIAGTDGYFKRVNPAFQKTLGWSTEELLARPFFDFVHPDDMASTESEVAKLADGIPTISFVNRYECADGSYKLLRWTSQPDLESGLMYANAHVVTERRGP